MRALHQRDVSQYTICKPREEPRLSIELWAHIFSFVRAPKDIFAIAQVCKAWHREVLSPLSDPLWRSIWDHRSEVSAENVDHVLPYRRVEGGWLDQVQASCRIAARDGVPRASIYLPPRYTTNGIPLADDELDMRPYTIDIEETLGRAVCSHAFSTDVVIGFEKGVGVLCFCTNSTPESPALQRLRARRARVGLSNISNTSKVQKPYFFFVDDPTLGGITRFAADPVSVSGNVLASTVSKHVVLISCPKSRHARHRRPISWRSLDNFETEQGTLVSLSTGSDCAVALAGFDTGRVRVISVHRGGLKHVLSMRESADLIANSGRWIMASNFFQPIGACIWDVVDGRAAHRLDQTSVGWEEIVVISGLSPAARPGRFVIWNGRDRIRIFDAETGRFVHIVDVRSRFLRGPARGPAEEAEFGAASAHVGVGKMVLSFDRRRAVVATSNRVMVTAIESSFRFEDNTQLDGASRSLVAFSTDERVVLTVDENAFGGLHTWVTGRASLAKSPQLRVWDASSGELRNAIVLPSAASELSVSGNVVAATAKAVGQVVVHRF